MKTPSTVLVIGPGGREHALARALSLDPGGHARCTRRRATRAWPAVATLHDVDPLDGAAVAALAESLGADLVVVGPEAPLVAGVADAVRARGIAVFGPSGAAAQLEGSKAFAKDVMAAAGVPDRAGLRLHHARRGGGSAGRVRTAVRRQGRRPRRGQGRRGDRGPPRPRVDHAAGCDRVVIEEYLDGPEVSLFAICGWNETDGATVYPLQPAQDFKRIFDGDAGPNTGGMGAYTPLTWSPDGPRRRGAVRPSCSRPSTRWRGGARRSRGSSTPGWH